MAEPSAAATAAWARLTAHIETSTGIRVPVLRRKPRASIAASSPSPNPTAIPCLTWQASPMLPVEARPDVASLSTVSLQLLEELEKLYSYEVARAKMVERDSVRLRAAAAEGGYWSAQVHHTEAALEAVEVGDAFAIAWHDSLLDLAQGREARWSDVARRELIRIGRKENWLLRHRSDAENARIWIHGQCGNVGRVLVPYIEARKTCSVSLTWLWNEASIE